MIPDLPLVTWVGLGMTGAVLLAWLSFKIVTRGSDDEPITADDGVTVVDEDEGTGAQVVELDEPDFKDPTMGMFGEMLQCWRYTRKRRKLAKKGYVQWFVVDQTWPSARYVKPKVKAGGIPEYEYDGGVYFFPDSARVGSAAQNMWTYVHHKNDADPINLNEPGEPAIPPEQAKEWQTMTVSKEAPSWLSNFDLDFEMFIKLALGAAVGYALLQGFMGGGLA